MKKLQLILAAVAIATIAIVTASVTQANAQIITEFPYSDGFESGSLPSGWTQEHIDSSLNWKAVTMESVPVNPYNGTYKAYIGASGSGHKTLLISPALYLNEVTIPNPVLKFWHAEKSSGSSYDELELFYKTSEMGEWISLKKFTENPEWIEAAISLPNPTEEYYIAFQATINYGYGVHLDDISIESATGTDGEAVNLLGPLEPMAGKAFTYKAHIKNLRSEALSGYTVKLIDGEGNILTTSSTNPEIPLGITEAIELLWTPQAAAAQAAEGTLSLRAVLEMPGDINQDNDSTDAITVNVQAAADEYEAVIGTSTDFATSIMPFDFSSVYSITQNIYYAHELAGQSGAITEIQYSGKFGSTKNNIPVKIWMANTDLEALSRWLPESEFTLVYDGTNTFPRGYSNVAFALDQPFICEAGKNLVIMIDRSAGSAGGGVSDAEFYNSKSADFPNRSRYYSADLEEFTWSSQQPGTGTNSYPNIVIKMGFEVGSVSGSVTDGANPANPVTEAVVEVQGTNSKHTTDAGGNYSFSLTPGTYQLKASKHGYIDTICSATVTGGNNSTLNLTLLPNPKYTVSGKITGSNAPNGLENVTVTLDGYEKYSTSTDEDGNYEIQDIYGGKTYSIRAELEGYVLYDSSLSVSAEATSHNILLYEEAYRVINPVAAEGSVSWGAPIVPHTIRYDNGVKGGRIGYVDDDPSVLYDEGIIGTTSTAATTLYRISWYIDTLTIVPAAQDVDIYIFTLKENGQPNRDSLSLIYSVKNIKSSPLQWNEYEFPEPIEMPNGFFAGLAASNGRYLSLGLDEPDNKYPFRNNTHWHTSNYTLADFKTFEASGTERNPMLRAEGIIHGQELVKPEPTGYIVYRLTEGQQEQSWIELDNNVADTVYTDADWASLPYGSYRYAIKSKYQGSNNISKPVLSNTITKSASISDIKIVDPIAVWPNPVTDLLNIRTEQNIVETVVIDQNGKLVKRQKNGNKQIDLSSLSAGYYVVRIRTSNGGASVAGAAAGVYSVKIVKQ